VRFHSIMAQTNAVIGYQEEAAYVHIPECRLSAFMRICRAVVEEFGISEDEIMVSTHHADRKSWIRLTVPFGAEKEVMEEEKEEVVDSDVEVEEGPQQKEDYVRLTDRVMYKVENGELIFVYENNGTRHNLFRVDMQKIYDLYDELPEKADRRTVAEVLERLKVKVPASYVNYLMQFLASYPVFSAELVKEKGRNYLLKRDGRVTEMRDKLAVEREVIGTPWEVA